MQLLSSEIQSVHPRYASTTPSIDPLDPDFLHKVICAAGSVAEEARRELDLLALNRIQTPVNEDPGRSDAPALADPANSLPQDDPLRGTADLHRHCTASTQARTRAQETQAKERESANRGKTPRDQ